MKPWNSDAWSVGLSITLVVCMLVFTGFAAWGYVLNLIGIANWSDTMGVLVLRVISAVMAPLGAILGWAL